MKQRVLIVGAGGHAHVVVDILQAMQATYGSVIPVGLVDDDATCHGSTVLGVPVVGPIGCINTIHHDAVIVAIGDNTRRRIVTERLANAGERFAIAIHPKSIVSASSSIGAGSMICAAAVVNPASSVGQGVILNTSCSVDHHNKIGDFVHIGPGARLGGEVTVGADTLVGIGAIVLPRIRIGVRSTVAGGAVVTNDVGDEVTVIGVPAKRYKREGKVSDVDPA